MDKLKRFVLNENVALPGVFIFLSILWVRLVLGQDLAPPDFYEYYQYAQRLFAGDFRLEVIPPLFPLLLGILGKLLGLFVTNIDSYLLAGQLISYFGGVLTLFYTYRLLRRFTGDFALIGIAYFSISPLFLKFVTLPLTDMLFLAFVMASLYYFESRHFPKSVMAAGLAMLTRFEGILVLLAGIVNYLKLKSRHTGIAAFLSVVLFCDLFYLFFRYASRLIKYIDAVSASQSYLYFFNNPLKILQIIYGNFLYFLPHRFPGWAKWTVFSFLLLFFVMGLISLFKKNWRFSLSLVFYMIVFITAKGYVVEVGLGLLHTRRLLSFLFLFVVVAFVGMHFLFEWLKGIKSGTVFLALRWAVFVALGFIILYLPFPKWRIFLPLLLLVPALGLVITRQGSGMKRLEKALAVLLILAFFGSLNLSGMRVSSRYVIAKPNSGGYAIAQWLNHQFKQTNKRPKILVYSAMEMVEYYLDHDIDLAFVRMRNKRKDENDRVYWREFFIRLQQAGVRFIITDDYMEGKFNPEEKTIKEMLRYEAAKGRFFKKIQILRNNKRNVGAVLKPNYHLFGKRKRAPKS
jgi:Gpi18-like mannosyltransferase